MGQADFGPKEEKRRVGGKGEKTGPSKLGCVEKNKEKMKEDWACWRKRKVREKRGKWTGPKEREKVEKEKNLLQGKGYFLKIE